MIKKRISNLKETIKAIKKDTRYKEYKKTFLHPSTRFFITYYLTFYKEALEVSTITKFEFEFMKIFNNNDNTLNNLGPFSKKIEILLKGTKCGKVKLLLEYFFFVYETSRYYYDKKHKIKNVFIDNDFVKINSEKRDYYYAWIKSIKAIDKDFNKVILYIKRKGI